MDTSGESVRSIKWKKYFFQVLETIAKGMNTELKSIAQETLKIPEIFSYNKEYRKEVVIMNDLRMEGFIMPDRKISLTFEQCMLVMRELGRFHASSLLYQNTTGCPVHEMFKEEFAVS